MFRYPGGKSKVKRTIIKHLNIYNDNEYREPFVGGGGIVTNLLKTRSCKRVWINDLDIGIANLWHVVASNPEGLKRLVKEYKPTTESFYRFKELLTSGQAVDPLESGFAKLAIHQISYSGLGTKSGGPLGGRKQESQYCVGCRWFPQRICSEIDRIHDLFSGDFRCTSEDFESSLEGSTVVYLDPPYFVKGDELYQHSFSLHDHLRLADRLKKTNCKWLLSYDDCPYIRNLYSWAEIENMTVTCTIRTARLKPELLIYNKEHRELYDSRYF